MSKPGQLSTENRASLPPFRVWGLTGGVAAGKTTAARFFSEEGIPVLDADQIARDLSQEGGAAYTSIVRRFGTADRKKLREVIFREPDARRDLESILHPLILTESLKRMKDLARLAVESHPLIIYEATLLVETGRYKEFEGLIVVDCPLELRRKRLLERDHSNSAVVQGMLSSQASDDARKSVATLILDNSGTLASLQKKVREISNRLKSIEVQLS